MRYVAPAVLLIGAATLGGCSGGVLDPKGPIASAERLILLNSLGIMLAIVIPTILATLGTAFWFRSSNRRARYLPDFDLFRPPGDARLVDPDHDRASGGRRRLGRLIRPRSAQADRLCGQARQGSSRLARLEMAVHLSRPGHCDRQSADRPGGHADQLRTDLVGRHEQLLRAAARRPDLHDGRDGDAPSSAGRPSRNLSGNVGKLQRRGIFRHVLQRRCGSSREICAVGGRNAHRRPGARRANLRRSGQAEPSGCAFHLSCRRSQPVQRHRELRVHAADSSQHAHPASQRAEK